MQSFWFGLARARGVAPRGEDEMDISERLNEALHYFNGDEAAAVLEHVVHARDGLITGSELLTKLQADVGEKFGTLADLGLTPTAEEQAAAR